jgi:hypothetical protein
MPARLGQLAVRLGVAFPVTSDFRRPELWVRFRDRVMLRASVPKATVNEDNHPRT